MAYHQSLPACTCEHCARWGLDRLFDTRPIQHAIPGHLVHHPHNSPRHHARYMRSKTVHPVQHLHPKTQRSMSADDHDCAACHSGCTTQQQPNQATIMAQAVQREEAKASFAHTCNHVTSPANQRTTS